MGFKKRSDSGMNTAISFVSNQESSLSKKIIFTSSPKMDLNAALIERLKCQVLNCYSL